MEAQMNPSSTFLITGHSLIIPLRVIPADVEFVFISNSYKKLFLETEGAIFSIMNKSMETTMRQEHICIHHDKT